MIKTAGGSHFCEQFAFALDQERTPAYLRCELFALSRAGMIICVCNRINDQDIRAAARAGATCCKQVFGGKGTAPQCGSCLDAMGEILDETIAAGERHLMAAE